MEDEEALQITALISQLANAVEDQVSYLFANGVVTTGVVVGGILFTGDQLRRVEQPAIGTSAYLI